MHVLKGSLYIVAAVVIWSSLGVIVRLADVAPHILIFYSVAVSVIVMTPYVASGGMRSQFPSRGKFARILVLGPILLINTFTFFYAYRHTTISNAILTHYIAPVLVAVFAPLILKEKTSRRVVASIVIASAGLFLLLGMNPAKSLSGWREPGSSAMGIAAGLASGVAYAALIIAVRALAIGVQPIVMCYIQNVTILLMLAPFIREFPVHALWGFLLVGIVQSTIAPVLYYRGMKYVQASRAAVLGYIEPFGAIIFGMIFLHEFPAPVSLLGGVLIIYSGWLVLSSNSGGQNA